MMNTDALFALFAIFALALLYLGPWQNVCTAYARQVVFEKRDSLFDMAVSGDLRFDSQEYREIRRSLEKLIRFAHDLTLLNFIVVNLYTSRHFKRPVSELRRNVQAIGNPEVRAKVEKLVSDSHRAVLIMMLAKSIVSLPAIMVWVQFRNHRHHTRRRIQQMAKPYGEWVQIEAEAAPVNTRGYALAA
jgi:hypothetical protein